MVHVALYCQFRHCFPSWQQATYTQNKSVYRCIDVCMYGDMVADLSCSASILAMI
jgi:hypothetical protein